MHAPDCQACSRRSLLSGIGGGFGMLALNALMRLEAKAASWHPVIDPVNPFLPRKPHFAPKAKSVIFLHMVGGPAQMDTFDYKPVLQKLHLQRIPSSIASSLDDTRFSAVLFGAQPELMASPFQFSQHGQSGMWVSELFPNIARHVDSLCFVHSMQADSNNHGPASYQLHTGSTLAGKASLGSWITYGLGTENQNLPGYVLLFEAGPFGGPANYSPGYLPAAFQGTRLRSEGMPVLDLLPSERFARGQRASLDLIHNLDLKHRASHPGVTELDARIASYELAYRMQSAALEVGDVEKEPGYLRRSYGLEHSDPQTVKFGRKCLLARRLVERGVRFVQIYNMFDAIGWDAHSDLKGNHEKLARQTDQPIAALLADLKERGLLDETLVVWSGEFGRTPNIEAGTGRQHNSAGFTIWMAGGGVKPGARIGATDEIGLKAIEQPESFGSLHATILAALGLNNDDLTFDIGGREERLTVFAGASTVIKGVLG